MPIARERKRDPSNQGLNAFTTLAWETLCPFARVAEVRLLEPRIAGNVWAPLVAGVVGKAARELPRADRFGGTDVFVVQLGPPFANDLDLLARSVHTVLYHLHGALGPSRSLYTAIDSTAWDLELLGLPYFAFAFAPFYTGNHIRYSHNPTEGFLLLQPDASFDRHGISSGASNRLALSRAIEEDFETAGIHYFGSLTRTAPKSHRVIKPPSPSGIPVRWWEAPRFN